MNTSKELSTIRAMAELLHHAFLDESGGIAIFVENDLFLVIAVLVTRNPRPVELLIKRAFKRFGTSLASGEMKAAHSEEKTIRWILAAIAQQEVEIVTVVVDKRGITKPPKDTEDLYRQTAAKAVRLCVERWPRLKVTMDKRYTHEHLRQKLEWQIREGIADIKGQAVVIRQVDSVRMKGLQAVDYVAWALWQKYQRGDDSYYRLIKDKVIVEEIVEVSNKKSGSPWAPISVCRARISAALPRSRISTRPIPFSERSGTPGFTIPL
ncbi:MAG: DUF3800 domain-containing protein [Anaerolineae bacterium]